jgi:nucleotide-binding universal stress UspA family protein
MKTPPTTVLCPTDGSATSNRAVPVAYRMVADGGQVHLLHVCQPPMLGNPIYPPYEQGYIPSAEETREGKAAVQAAMEALVPASAAARAVASHIHLVNAANPAMAIAETFAAVHADVVVMGTHGRTGFVRFALGSVASDVMKRGLPTILVYEADGD